MENDCSEDIYLDTIADETRHHKYCPMARTGKHTLCACIELIAAELAAKAEHYADMREDR